jgi:hypothetical protein
MTLKWKKDVEGNDTTYEKFPDGSCIHIRIRNEDADGDAIEIAPGIIHHPDGEGWVADGAMFHVNNRLCINLRSPSCDSEQEAKVAAETVWLDLRFMAEGIQPSIGTPGKPLVEVLVIEDDEDESAIEPPADNDAPFIGDVEVFTRFATALMDVMDHVADEQLVYFMQRFESMNVPTEDAVGVMFIAFQEPDRAQWIGRRLDPEVFARMNAFVARITRVRDAAGVDRPQ